MSPCRSSVRKHKLRMEFQSPTCLRGTPSFSPTRLLRSEEHTSELQSQSNLVCRLLLEKIYHTQSHQHTQSSRRVNHSPFAPAQRHPYGHCHRTTAAKHSDSHTTALLGRQPTVQRRHRP